MKLVMRGERPGGRELQWRSHRAAERARRARHMFTSINPSAVQRSLRPQGNRKVAQMTLSLVQLIRQRLQELGITRS